jgi:hypothetical protein
MFEAHAHGAFELKVEGLILHAYIIGSWNIQAAYDYKEAVEKIIKPLVGHTWAMISVVDEWELYTPDCKPIMIELSHYAYASGLCKEAIVNQVASVKLEAFPAKIKGFPTFQRQFFHTKEEAVSWLNDEGF